MLRSLSWYWDIASRILSSPLWHWCRIRPCLLFSISGLDMLLAKRASTCRASQPQAVQISCQSAYREDYLASSVFFFEDCCAPIRAGLDLALSWKSIHLPGFSRLSELLTPIGTKGWLPGLDGKLELMIRIRGVAVSCFTVICPSVPVAKDLPVISYLVFGLPHWVASAEHISQFF